MTRVDMRYLLAVAIIIMRRRRRRRKGEIKKQKRARRFWGSPLNQERELLGVFYSTVLPARIQDRFFFFKYLRIIPRKIRPFTSTGTRLILDFHGEHQSR